MKVEQKTGITRARRACFGLPTLYYKPLPEDDGRLKAMVGQTDFIRLRKRLEAQGESLDVKRAQVYHLNGFTTILVPVLTPPAVSVLKFASYRLHRYGGGPQTLLFEFHGAIGAEMTVRKECLTAVTISGSSGKNRITIRPEGRLADGQGLVKVLHCDIQDEDEDDGFWGKIGDFFEGVIDEIAEFFEELWGWIKEVASEIWDEIMRGDARPYTPDPTRPPGPDNWAVEKRWRF